MSFSHFLDLAWTHVLSQSSAMGNPYEYREVMKAAFGYIDKTVEEVQAEQRQRQKESLKEKPSSKGRRPPNLAAVPRQSEIDKMNEILAKAKPPSPPALK